MLRRAIGGLLIACAVILVLLLGLGFRPRHIAGMLSHPVTGGTAPEGVVRDVAPDVPEHAPPRRSFGKANYAVLGIYLAAMLGIGVYTSRRIKGTRGYFIADGRMNHVVVGLSLLGTYLSALTMMGLPGMAYGKHDWTYMVQLPFLVVTAVVITRLVLPRYRKAGFISVYEHLEHRIDVSVRVLASISFLVFSIARMGLVLYLPALAFSTVTGVPLPVCVIGMGIVITAYTVLGGMEAVIWTDAIQVVIFIVGAVLTLAYIFADLGADEFVRTASAHNKFRLLVPSLDVTRITSLWLVLAILAYIPVGFIFYFIGTALFAFYKAHPAADLPGKADPMYPHFIVSHLPPGIAGLVIAAIFAAAMSSIDSLMNSSSTVCIEDLWKRFARTERPDRSYLVKARMLTILWGALAVVMGLLFMEVEYALVVWGKVMGISTNGILALMALAFLPFRVSKWAAIAGFGVGYACLFTLMYATKINFLLWPVIGNVTSFLAALLVHWLIGVISARRGRAEG